MVKHFKTGDGTCVIKAHHYVERAAETIFSYLNCCTCKRVALMGFKNRDAINFERFGDIEPFYLRQNGNDGSLLLGSIGSCNRVFGEAVNACQKTGCYERDQRQREQHVRKTGFKFCHICGPPYFLATFSPKRLG